MTVTVTSPFHNDPPPNLPDGTRAPSLWQYEVAEIFFLNSKDQYFQVMVGPRRHYMAYMYEGSRKKVRNNIILDIKTTFSDDRSLWTAVINIPIGYLPVQADQFNGYLSYGTGENRQYEAYSPAYPTEKQPDYHNLRYFGSIDLDIVMWNFKSKPQSETWKNVLQR